METADTPKHTNQLAKEKSPYLLQHAHNPVDWYPWGAEAFEKAKADDKPIFLSIGYSTCHWCHVMERESFEDGEIAAFMNEHFINVKVDREERPDVDQIYMAYVQLRTGHGGWPLSVFLTPDRKPFFGGTYFPPKSDRGMPGFLDLLEEISRVWKENRVDIDQGADQIAATVKRHTERSESGTLTERVLQSAYGRIRGEYDGVFGGFGGAPKFPSSTKLSLLMRHHRRTGDEEALSMVEKTLEMMYRGGMYDHLGGGFHRYSTDSRWLVPHFEKMLYDNALLGRAYLEAYQVTGKETYARVAREVLDYVIRDMTAPEGGFYSAEDADSEGEEGLFYVWTPGELVEHLGEEEGKLVARYFGVTEEGNFEQKMSILHLPVAPETFAEAAGIEEGKWEEILTRAKKTLLEQREKRMRPHRDDKVITSWNGLMISTMAYAHQVLGEPRYRDAARKAADFLLENLIEDGRVLRRHREEADILGYVDDYAFLSQGMLDLYEATFDERYFREAVRLTDEMVRLFWDDEGKGFFFVGKDGGKDLIARPKELYGGAIPSGNSIAALNLLRLSEWTTDPKWRELGEETLRAFGSQVSDAPHAFPEILCALDFLLDTPKEIVLAGRPGAEDLDALLRTIHSRYVPNRVIALVPRGGNDDPFVELMPMLKDRGTIDGKATAYVCENYTCRAPTNDPATLATQLQ